jgi:hypothetical protein
MQVILKRRAALLCALLHAIWRRRRPLQEGGLGYAPRGSPRFFALQQSHCGATDVRMLRDGPPRMEGRSTWSGRERSSHSRFPPVPRVRLVTFRFSLPVSPPYQALTPRKCATGCVRPEFAVTVFYRSVSRVSLGQGAAAVRVDMCAWICALRQPGATVRKCLRRAATGRTFGGFRFIWTRWRC